MLADASSASQRAVNCETDDQLERQYDDHDAAEDDGAGAVAAPPPSSAIDYQVLSSVIVDLSQICDVKDAGGATPVYRYNEAKALAWLNRKLGNRAA